VKEHSSHRFGTRTRVLSALAAGLAVVLASPMARALNFPQDPQWIPITCNGQPLTGEAGEIQPPAIDAVGDAANPGAYVFTDGTSLFLRLRMEATVQQNATTYEPYAWACLLRTSANPNSYLAWDGVNGLANPQDVELLENSMVQPGDPTLDPADTVVATYPIAANAREAPAPSNIGGNPNVFIDWAVSLSDLATIGITQQTPMRFICGTSRTPRILDGDLFDESCAGGISDAVLCTGASCLTCTTAAECGPACAACSGATPLCNPAVGCTASCTGDAQCAGTTPICDTARGLCVGCASDANCAAGTYCDVASGACAPCPQGASTCTGPSGSGNVLADGSIEGGAGACDVGGGGRGPGVLAGLVLGLAAVLRARRQRSR
jgi:hypothetical protein